MPEDLSLARAFGPVGAAAETKSASGPRAGFWRRFGAELIDSLIFCVAAFGAAALGLEWRSVAFTSSFAVVSLVYYTYLEGGPSGQTLGKRIAGIRVMDLDTGAPLGYGRAAVRHMARTISGVLLGIGYAWMLWDAERQTWHDKLSDAVVVPVEDYPVE